MAPGIKPDHSGLETGDPLAFAILGEIALNAIPHDPIGYNLNVRLAGQEPLPKKLADATTPKTPDEPTTTV